MFGHLPVVTYLFCHLSVNPNQTLTLRNSTGANLGHIDMCREASALRGGGGGDTPILKGLRGASGKFCKEPLRTTKILFCGCVNCINCINYY